MRVTPCLRQPYPRIVPSSLSLSHKNFLEKYSRFQGGDSTQEVVIRGRITAKRSAGQKLFFLDSVSEGNKIQVVGRNLSQEIVGKFKGLGKGDHVEVKGTPGRTDTGELSIFATDVVPLSQCRHRVPEQYSDYTKRMKYRHIDYIVNKSSSDVIRTRSVIISTLRHELERRNFLELETPILQTSASGATARPFETHSVLGLPLQLKIAPELALKRAVLGNFDRVFEIGKNFRNEGLSRKHSPEFTTCEFYQAYAGLEDLIELTKELLFAIESAVSPQASLFVDSAFRRLSFIPTIEKAIGRTLPEDEQALLRLVKELNIHVAEDASIADLYDALAKEYIEPLCGPPTFVTDLPSALSSLAKSTGSISHRFEMYVNHMELINAYEEENDPVTQRAKFESQNHGVLTPEEEDYCKALEWGLPPTGGFGIGIDRLVMLLTGVSRINETLLGGGIIHQPRATKPASDRVGDPIEQAES